MPCNVLDELGKVYTTQFLLLIHDRVVIYNIVLSTDTEYSKGRTFLLRFLKTGLVITYVISVFINIQTQALLINVSKPLPTWECNQNTECYIFSIEGNEFNSGFWNNDSAGIFSASQIALLVQHNIMCNGNSGRPQHLSNMNFSKWSETVHQTHGCFVPN